MAEGTVIVLDPEEQDPAPSANSACKPTNDLDRSLLSRPVLETCLNELQGLYDRDIKSASRNAWWAVLQGYRTDQVRRGFRVLFETEGSGDSQYSRFPKPGQLVALIRNADLASRHDHWERLAAEVPYCKRCGSSGMVTVWAAGKPAKRFWVPQGPERDRVELPADYAYDGERVYSFMATCGCPHGERRAAQFGWMQPYRSYLPQSQEGAR